MSICDASNGGATGRGACACATREVVKNVATVRNAIAILGKVFRGTGDPPSIVVQNYNSAGVKKAAGILAQYFKEKAELAR
jgi:hypothetical protein